MTSLEVLWYTRDYTLRFNRFDFILCRVKVTWNACVLHTQDQPFRSYVLVLQEDGVIKSFPLPLIAYTLTDSRANKRLEYIEYK